MKIFKYMLMALLFGGLAACASKPKIAVSKASGSSTYETYKIWLEANDDDEFEFLDLYKVPVNKIPDYLEGISGLVLTGGPDVHPKHFGKAYDSVRCSIDEHRDSIEFAAIDYALKNKIPILGICRGEQILNVALGGSLIIDIPEDIGKTISHQYKSDPEDAYHEITIESGSVLSQISGSGSYKVNSNHHQSIDLLAPGLKITARTKDNVVEAYEWEDINKKPFILAVQWHPERMEPKDNLLSKNIAKRFFSEVKNNINITKK